MAGVLLVTRRSVLVEEVGRLAAAASVPVDVVVDAGAARRAWLDAELVLLGDDAAALGVPVRRGGTVLLALPGAGERVWRSAVEVGAQEVLVLPDGEQALLHHLARAGEPPGAGGRVVGVVGGRGGAGASVLAAALAVTAARRRRALLVDGDPLGGGLDLLLGAEDAAGLRWADLAAARGTVRASLLREALPVAEGVPVLAWGREPGGGAPLPAPAPAVEAVLDAGARGSDLVVVDLPRRDDPATVAALWRLDLLLLVVPAEVRAVASARRVRDLVAPHTGDLRVVAVVPPRAGVGAAALADALELPLLARTAPEAGLRAALDRGEPPGSRRRGALAACCQAVLAAVEDEAPAVGAA
ncbi:septum site-determining protein Ssd [Quadrisphaera sp. DSM 44207]|uniref:septum site-determining protein Ssd n=1 Tax=Quadrisphaera sp. DSM 44207 TaxID=1881057 RepID=UPI000880CE2B|nr:septum site-determining protein Ssd [Quadrisphaera sp. DSM 44207]SDQ17808.1 helicase/secretion neighborhood CpaE-like protein [Quadrisphaera sp. DSM 44207]